MFLKFKRYTILFAILALIILSCHPKPVMYSITDNRFIKIESDTRQYFMRADGISLTLTVSPTKSHGMKIFLSINNNQYPSISYRVDQVKLTDTSKEKDINSIYVDNQKTDNNYECKIYKNNNMNVMYIIRDMEKDKVETHYTLSLGKIIVGKNKKEITLNDINITSEYEK